MKTDAIEKRLDDLERRAGDGKRHHIEANLTPAGCEYLLDGEPVGLADLPELGRGCFCFVKDHADAERGRVHEVAAQVRAQIGERGDMFIIEYDDQWGAR